MRRVQVSIYKIEGPITRGGSQVARALAGGYDLYYPSFILSLDMYAP